MKVALIQMNSQENKAANLTQAKQLVERAVAEERPDLVVLPELFTMLSESVDAKRSAAEDLPGGEAYEMLRNLAATHRIILHGGSFLERAGDKFYNTTVVFDRAGKELARYRKIHLFDVDIPGGATLRESDATAAGDELVVVSIHGAPVGLSICYDVRFPELYRSLVKDRGAEILLVPAAFTAHTGAAHWHLLLRARAVEDQAWVVAAAQWGQHSEKRASYGHTLISDPWGTLVGERAEGDGVVVATLDSATVEKRRSQLPSLRHAVLWK